MFIAPLLAIIVPLIVVPDARLTAPSTFQKTLHANAPLINFTFVLVAEDNAPCNLKIKTALGFPFASNIRFPLNVITEFVMEYTAAVNVSPLPIVVEGNIVGVAEFN